MLDLVAASKSFEDLRDFVSGEPRLSHLRPVTDEMARVARNLASGTLEYFQTRPEFKTTHIPNRELAVQLLDRVSRIPGYDGDESEDLKKAYSYLLAGVVDAVMHVIFRDYADIVPRSKPSGS